MTEQNDIIEVPAKTSSVMNALQGLIPEEEFQKLGEELIENNPSYQRPENANNPPVKTEEEIAAEKVIADKAEADRLAAEANKGAEKTTEEIEAEKVEAEKVASAKAESDKKNIFGLGKKKTDAQAVAIEKPEQILDLVKTKYGQDLKDISEIPKFIESVDKWRASAQKTEILEKENTELKKLWEEVLPSQFLEAAKAYTEGKDYVKVFNGSAPKFDFKVAAEKQDIKSLVNHYFPDKFSDEDFSDTEESPALQIAKQASIDKFKTEKQAFDNQSAVTAKKAQDRLVAIKGSINGSIDYLKRKFPDTDNDIINDVKKSIDGGPASVLSFFFENDGTAKPEAAQRLLMAMHGESQIEYLIGIAANQVETKINEERLTRGADGKKPSHQGTATKNKISDEVKQKIDDIERISDLNKKTF